MIIFVESNISALTVGTIFRPIFDKLKISREKLAYIADSTSAPSKLLIPFNGWGAFIMGLLLPQGIENPFKGLVYVFDYLNVGVDANSLNVIYNLADFINKIAFGLVIWAAATQASGKRSK
mgnify:CR=1 FL=1